MDRQSKGLQAGLVGGVDGDCDLVWRLQRWNELPMFGLPSNAAELQDADRREAPRDQAFCLSQSLSLFLKTGGGGCRQPLWERDPLHGFWQQ